MPILDEHQAVMRRREGLHIIYIYTASISSLKPGADRRKGGTVKKTRKKSTICLHYPFFLSKFAAAKELFTRTPTIMPRKTNGIVYELHPRPTKGDDGQPLLYAKPVITRKYNLDDLDNFCARYRGTNRGDMKRFCELCKDVYSLWLRQGHRVETPFGSLAPTLKLHGDHTNPDDVTGNDISYNGLEFIPSKEFEQLSDCSADGFRQKEHFPWETKRAQGKEALERAVLNAIKTGGYTTVADFMDYSGLKYTAAKDYLNSLCKGDASLLRKIPVGRANIYKLKGDSPDNMD